MAGLLVVCHSSIAIALVAAGAAHQQMPDFSGDWILTSASRPAANHAQSLTIRRTEHQTDTRGAPMHQPPVELEVQRNVSGAIRTERYTVGLEGGTVSAPVRDPSNRDVASRSRTFWSARLDGDRLVIETAEYEDGPGGSRRVSDRREVWSLDPSGRLVIVLVNRSADAGAGPVTLTYERP